MKQFYTLTYIFFCLLICPLASIGQSKQIDSLRKVLRTQKEDTNKANSLYDLGLDYFHASNYKTADSLIDIEIALALKTNFKKDIALGYDLKGKLYQANNNNTDALKCYEQALKLCPYITQKDIEATTDADIGIIYENEGNYPEALKNQLAALKIRENLNDTLYIDIVCGNIGNIYNYQGNYTEAILYKERSLALAKAIKDTLGMGYAYGDMGSIYNSLKKYDDALMNLQLALNINKKMNDKQGIGNAELNIGNTYNQLGNYEKALEYTYQGLEVYRAMGTQYLMCYGYDNIAFNYLKEKNYTKALVYTDSIILTGKKVEGKELLKDAYMYLAEIDSVNNNYKDAFASYKTFTLYRDSLKNEENTKKIVSEQMNYEFDKKQAVEKAEQDKKDAIAQDKSKRQKLMILLMAAIALAVAIIAIVILRTLRITRHQKELIEKQKQVVEEQKQLVEHQKAIVDEKNKDITDSIHYASRIQRALLTTDGYIKKYLKEYFILFKPRDIVSGDFYWAFNAPDAPLPPEGGSNESFGYETSDPVLYSKLKDFVKENRSIPTEAENIFWQLARGKNIDGYKFRRQHIIGPYIADFVCLSHKLIIEIDGLIHQLPENIQNDIERTYYMNNKGFQVLRFSNSEVINNSEAVVQQVLTELHNQEQQIPLSGGGGAFYMACCDCTGHGVPGAFMSLLNISMLNESVVERKIIRPDFVLNDIRTNIIKALNPDGSDEGKDGMDCSLCLFDFKNNILKVSCANNPVWIIKKDKTFIEIAPDKMPVGIQYGEQKPFTIHTTHLDKGDCVYMLTDGYADQFGGPKGKKFKYKTLQELLIANADKPMAEQQNILNDTIENWKGELEQVDDILLMGIRV